MSGFLGANSDSVDSILRWIPCMALAAESPQLPSKSALPAHQYTRRIHPVQSTPFHTLLLPSVLTSAFHACCPPASRQATTPATSGPQRRPPHTSSSSSPSTSLSVPKAAKGTTWLRAAARLRPLRVARWRS